MSYQLIDMTKDPRSGQFACFRQMLFPFAGVTAEVDITDFAARRRGRPFFLSFLYAVVRAANAVPQLRRRIRGTAAWWNTTGVRPPTPPRSPTRCTYPAR